MVALGSLFMRLSIERLENLVKRAWFRDILRLLCCFFFVSFPLRAKEISCPLVDRAPEDRFVPEEVLEDFEENAQPCEAVEGSQQAEANTSLQSDGAQSGRRCLRVDYRFEPRENFGYAEIRCDLPLEHSGKGVGFWFLLDHPDLVLKIRVKDRSGETHQIDVPRGVPGKWCFTAAMLEEKGELAWGGDGNGELDFPCRLGSIVVDRPHGDFRAEGTLLFDRFVLVEKPPQTNRLKITTQDFRLGNIYRPGERIRLTAALRDAAETDQQGEIRWKVFDYANRLLTKGEGDLANTSIAFQVSRPGYYECRIDWIKLDGIAESRQFTCAVLSPEKGPWQSTQPNTLVGMCCHFRRNAYPPEAMELLKRYGIFEFRDEISWSNVETERREYQIPEYGNQFTSQANRMGLNPLLICDYSNQFYADGGFPNDKEAYEAFGRYCGYLASQMRGRVDEFEIWNEWSVGCGMKGKPGSNAPEYYVPLLKEAYRAIKSVDPRITVVGLGGEHSANHFENIRVMFQEGAAESMDAFSVHSYRYPRNPEKSDLFGEIMKVAELASEFDAPERIWVTEIGWPTHLGSRGVAPRVQARYAVRTLAILQSTGVVEKVHWYDFKDDGLERTWLFREFNG